MITTVVPLSLTFVEFHILDLYLRYFLDLYMIIFDLYLHMILFGSLHDDI